MTFMIKEFSNCYELYKTCEGDELKITDIWFDIVSPYKNCMISKREAYEIIQNIKKELEIRCTQKCGDCHLKDLEFKCLNVDLNLDDIIIKKYKGSYKIPSNSKRKYGVTKQDRERWRNQLFRKYIN